MDRIFLVIHKGNIHVVWGSQIATFMNKFMHFDGPTLYKFYETILTESEQS